MSTQVVGLRQPLYKFDTVVNVSTPGEPHSEADTMKPHLLVNKVGSSIASGSPELILEHVFDVPAYATIVTDTRGLAASGVAGMQKNMIDVSLLALMVVVAIGALLLAFSEPGLPRYFCIAIFVLSLCTADVFRRHI